MNSRPERPVPGLVAATTEPSWGQAPSGFSRSFRGSSCGGGRVSRSYPLRAPHHHHRHRRDRSGSGRLSDPPLLDPVGQPHRCPRHHRRRPGRPPPPGRVRHPRRRGRHGPQVTPVHQHRPPSRELRAAQLPRSSASAELPPSWPAPSAPGSPTTPPHPTAKSTTPSNGAAADPPTKPTHHHCANRFKQTHHVTITLEDDAQRSGLLLRHRPPSHPAPRRHRRAVTGQPASASAAVAVRSAARPASAKPSPNTAIS